MPKVHLTTFAGIATNGDPNLAVRQERLHNSALQYGGIDKVIPWQAEKLLQTSFARKNHSTFEQPTGFGYWLWKPYIILDALHSVAQNDYVIYHDVGHPQRGDLTRGNTINRNVTPLLRWADANGGIYPGVFMPHHGQQRNWTKRDCFILMGCDSKEYWDTAQIQAGYNIWKNTPRSRDFVAEWLRHCEDPRILTDIENTQGQENLPGFTTHRHDQSILTNLCIKNGVRPYGSPKIPTFQHRNFNTLIRHAHYDDLKANGNAPLRSIVAANNSNIFDKSMIRWIELYFCDRREDPLSILLVGNCETSIWRGYFSNASIVTTKDLDNAAVNSADFDLVVVTIEPEPEKQLALLSACFPKVRPGGLLACGKVKKQWDALPERSATPLSIVRDYWKHKKVLHPSLAESTQNEFNQKLQTSLVAWDSTGASGNVFFVRHES